MILSRRAALLHLGVRAGAMVRVASGLFGKDLANGGAQVPARIVSLAPSITEIAFELGLGGRLVGVTRYCDHPAAALEIPRVGGYVDPSYEEIVGRKADLVILLASQGEVRARLEKLRVRTLATPHETIRDVHQAIRLIGGACGRPAAAEELVGQLEMRVRRVADAVRGRVRPRVLMCLGREVGSGELTGLHVAGREGWHDELIGLSGGVNAFTGAGAAFAQISVEGVIRLDPEVIVELQGGRAFRERKEGEAGRSWSRLGMVSAVRMSRVHVLDGDAALRPGPRYVGALEQLIRLLHPGVARTYAP